MGRFPGRGWIGLWALLAAAALWGGHEAHGQSHWTIPPVAPVLINGRMECELGFTPGVNPIGKETTIPNGWTVLYVQGAPTVGSTRLTYARECNRSESVFIERTFGGGYDSLVVRSQDIETLPEPGKPFDIVLYQPISATVGGTYSLSGWMVTTCEDPPGSRTCPEGIYIAKAIGIDPLGGVDPDAGSVIWEENRRNFADPGYEGWQNLRLGVRALAPTITVFARMTSPFQLRGNKGFMDEFSLVRAPVAALGPLPARVEAGGQVTVTWTGLQSADVEAIGGTYALLFDVQTRHVGREPDGDDAGEWRDWVIGERDRSSRVFTAKCVETSYQFRVRARAEQPDGSGGVAPNHRYPGVWSEPATVYFAAAPPAPHSFDAGDLRLYVPSLVRDLDC
ncbi:MAG TPA: hypothetical protein VNK95_18170 [Caldilineaceae bacterium]|nr:hypothetical protein [Caldilineaceae bacterium]